MAGTANLFVDQGADYGPTTFQLTSDGVTPVNVTGYTAEMQLRTAPGTILLLQLTNGTGITVGTTNGNFVVAMTAAQTALLNQDCHYDLLVTDGSGKKTRLSEGTVFVDLAISA